MSNFNKAVDVLGRQGWGCGGCGRLPTEPVDECYECEEEVTNTVKQLAAAGLLAPDSHIVRTVSELEALDPDTWLMQADEEAIPMVVDDWIHDYNFDSDGIFPLVVMMDGAQVRAAREALEQEHE